MLGLIWETFEDKLQVDVKLNTGGKVGGARVQDDIDLEEDLSQALPGAITKRILWRVAQGLYDPLGLLCAFTIRFKIVMRSFPTRKRKDALDGTIRCRPTWKRISGRSWDI